VFKSTKKGNMPVPQKWSGQDRRFGETLKNSVDVLAGFNGNPLDRAITARDLLDSGIARLAVGSITFSGGSNGLAPTGNIPTYDVPPAPTNLSARGAFQNIILTWNLESYIGHSYVEVYRHTSDVIADASLTAQVSGAIVGIYSDSTGPSADFYYWVRAVNENGVAGPFNSSTGTRGQTAADVDLLLGVLTDAITESELATDLQTEIDKISGDIYVAGSVASQVAAEAILRAAAVSGEATARAAALSAEASARATAISSSADALQAQLNDFTGIAAWDSAESYSIDDKVRHDDKLWSADAASSDSEPTYSNGASTNSDWELTGDYTSLASVTANNSAAITAINNVSTDSSSAAAVAFKALSGEVFAADGTSLLATGSALTGLTTDVRDIYTAADGDDPASGLLASAQASITGLNGEVFAADGSSLLATGSALTGLTTDVRSIYTVGDDTVDPVVPASGILASVQSDVTTLNGEVFNEDGSSLLATGSAVTGLTTDVRYIYTAADGDTAASGILASVQSDVTTLNGQVFAADGSSLLATGSAVSGLTTDVRDIYTAADGNTPASGILSSVQSDVTDLNGEVFDEDGASLLATGSAVSGLTTDVRDIYTEADGDNPASGILASVQSDVTDLNAEVFAANGASLLATGQSVTSLTNNVNTIYDADGGVDDDGNAIPSGLVASSQEEITALKGAVFNGDGDVKLASGSSVSTLTNNVNAIYDADGGLDGDGNAIPSGLLTSAQSSITALQGAVFDEDNGVKLAEAAAVETLETEVYGDGSAGASRIDGLYTALFDDEGDLFASASALEALDTAVTGEGGIASKVTNIAAAMYTDSDTTGSSLFATSANLDTVTAQVFPDGLTETSRISQLSSALYTNGNPDDGVKLASADFVSNINTAVFGDGTTQTASANKVDTLQVVVEGADGNGGIKNAIETTQEIVGDSTSGLQAQYTVKIDTNGAVAGFGLASTSNAAGNITSEFIVNADRFAIMRGGSNAAAATIPFAVVPAGTVDGVNIPAGVFMTDAFIRNGTIVNAKIKNLAIDDAKIASLNADKITAGTIDASKVTLSGVSPSFQIKSATTGQRMEMDADVIRVFDSGNVLRVKLGNLS